ncbi:iron-containing redox enzyme family protein [Stigmatella sp. ncwal1]|uniref:Iron-containing redox enzyme family protein n=1 Tax=Stigmatella ashevillensis TaxID=2995309 RepID=A0ABT5DJ04_9BACT|nr:iron-containing redox enzyme family protein [Stigmatella ashevillena]MDC0713625.1 iron-containing redox enzyme family protein [Stigmatella ashevillena]
MTTATQLSARWSGLLPRESLERLDATVFLTRCRQGMAARDVLETFLVQQYHYSRHFTRYLCALLANMTSEADRFALTENLFEEMGLGGMGEIPHSQIYRQMLDAFGLDPSTQPPLAETTALVRGMLRLCSDAEPLVGLGALCLGAEAIVPHVYQQILTGLLSAGFPERELTFFPLHIEGDDGHALTMKQIIERELAARPDKRSVLRAAAEESIETRRAFFAALAAPTVEAVDTSRRAASAL